eukprot:2670519-Prymnesium_polylepis.1
MLWTSTSFFFAWSCDLLPGSRRASVAHRQRPTATNRDTRAWAMSIIRGVRPGRDDFLGNQHLLLQRGRMALAALPDF